MSLNPRQRARPSRALLEVILLTGLLVSCSTDAGRPATTPNADPGLDHIHGLGINPADDTLYAASHFGVFRIVEGAAVRQGELWQDTMGFTVVGPDRFLGSGHPDFQRDTVLDEDMTPLLGLVESADGAETWSGVSLQGEADFHGLATVGAWIYGFDSTGARFVASNDGGRTWDTRSEDLALLSFAPDPADPLVVVATAATGTLRSTDGGRSWAHAADAPPLAYVSWDADGGLYGVDADGRSYRSEDAAASWTEVGTIGGEPAALLTTPSAVYVATMESIVRSLDGGATFETVYEIPDRALEVVE